MRIPIPIVILVTILTISLTWWLGTRRLDFLAEPTAPELEAIRQEALASLITSTSNQDAISIPQPDTNPTNNTTQTTPNLEPIDIGDTSAPLTLDAYSNRTPEGAQTLLRLATSLENANSPERAILALERIIDLTAEATPEETQTAILRIHRLRSSTPPWNTEIGKSKTAIIHIGTGQKFADILPAIIETTTKELNASSSGIIQFSSKLHIGKRINTSNAPTPLAIWITGPGDEPISTDVLSFTTNNPETLNNELFKTIFNIIRSHLSKTTSYNPVPETLEAPLPALQSHITRLLWNELAQNLNPEPN